MAFSTSAARAPERHMLSSQLPQMVPVRVVALTGLPESICPDRQLPDSIDNTPGLCYNVGKRTDGGRRSREYAGFRYPDPV